MKKSLILFFLTFALVWAAQSDDKFSEYKQKYGNPCLGKAVTDNRGNGYDELYGTRNLKVILHGVAYRGGANNYYHKKNKRDNRNPLPDDGLKNLADEGFSAAYYLYATNFSSAPKSMKGDGGNEMKYINNTLSNSSQVEEMIADVYNVIKNPELGPVYLHCWNGWHQSGYSAAVLLRQYCGFSGEQAVKYWEDNAAGGKKGYTAIKKKIRDFKPLKKYQIDKKTRDEICPCNK